jgi:cephalosporin hydroxylase
MSTAISYASRTLQEIYDQGSPWAMHRWHHYIPIYEQYFATLRHRPINMLEIGIQHGGGLHMWHRYFHPGSRIHGVDINPNCTVPDLPNVTATIGDQADPQFWADLLPKLGPLDIVIDDGGHTMNQQIVSFDAIYPTMSPYGIYLVEDTHTSLWGGSFHDRPKDKVFPTFMDAAYQDVLSLMEWSGNPHHFNTLMTDRRRELDDKVSRFCRTTQAIHFYDSLVVYERGPRRAPGHALR